MAGKAVYGESFEGFFATLKMMRWVLHGNGRARPVMQALIAATVKAYKQ